ncbi:hypothetical protein ACSBR2_012856 [Camellia fascicularis]
MGCKKILLVVLQAIFIVMLLLPFHQVVASRELLGTSHFLVSDMRVMDSTEMKEYRFETDSRNGNYFAPAAPMI